MHLIALRGGKEALMSPRKKDLGCALIAAAGVLVLTSASRSAQGPPVVNQPTTSACGRSLRPGDAEADN
jgi:hypothetical protein